MMKYLFAILSVFNTVTLFATIILLHRYKLSYVNHNDAIVDICFTPPYHTCEPKIIKAINSAEKSIHVQAYSFTSDNIIKALIAAKTRGVNISIILDKSNVGKSHVQQLCDKKINVTIDATINGLAHNKIMIIDSVAVITGSYNFSNDANEKNAENVVIMYNKEIADKYYNNWLSRLTANRNTTSPCKG